MNEDEATKQLLETLAAHQISIPGETVPRLARFCWLLWGWNEQLNLTRHTDFEKFVTRDLADTLQLSALIDQGEEVLDIGSGGGVPGVTLAILRPDLQISLTESVGKKSRALQDIVEKLKLPTPIYACRAEDVMNDFRFDLLTARAVGPLWKICRWLEPHWASIGRLLAIKGPRWVEERGEARHRGYLSKLELRRVASYPLEGTDAESVILKIWWKDRPEPGPVGDPS